MHIKQEINYIKERKPYNKSEQSHEKQAIKKLLKCKLCGTEHVWNKELCPAFNKTCSNCGKLNNFRKQCRKPSKRRDETNCIYIQLAVKWQVLNRLPEKIK